jgi:hypothetical protein
MAKSNLDALKPWVDPVAIEIQNQANKNKAPVESNQIDIYDIDIK